MLVVQEDIKNDYVINARYQIEWADFNNSFLSKGTSYSKGSWIKENNFPSFKIYNLVIWVH